MPRSRGSEMSQRQSPRVPLHLKTTAASEANSLHRPTTDRSPKLDDHRSPRGGGGPLHEKKRGTRVADLETKLGHAQEELKKLKEELATAEAAKRGAQQELEEAKKKIPVAPSTPEQEEEKPLLLEESATQGPDPQDDAERPPDQCLGSPKGEAVPVEPPATDVFEVVPPAVINPEGKEDSNEEEVVVVEKEEETGTTTIEVDGNNELGEELQDEGKSKPAEYPENPEISELRAMLAEKEKEMEMCSAENESLKKQAAEAKDNAVVARAKEEELGAKLYCMEEELRGSRAKTEGLEEQLGVAEGARAALEAEMKRLKVQTDQWRKAAEAAAAVLAAGEGGMEAGGRQVAERCGSMDKHLSRYGAGWSPLMGGEEMDEDVLGGGKRKGSGIRMFGDLWKRKGSQK